jgi:hypothetical protein
VVERKNQTLIDMARTMPEKYKTSDRFWAKVVNRAYHAISWLYLHRLLKKTCYEFLIENKPNVSYFRVFGSKCYILAKRSRNSKFAPKAVEVFFYFVMIQTQGHIESSTNSRDVLKFVVTLCLTRLTALEKSKLILMN